MQREESFDNKNTSIVDTFLKKVDLQKANPEEERKVLEDIARNNHISKKNLDSVFNIYLELLPFTKFASEQEQFSVPSEQRLQTARSNAAKLAILFGNTQKAMEYIKRFEKIQEDGQTQIVHDACLFTLPESDDWNIKLWQTIISNHNPSNPQDMVMRRIIPFADKIEIYVKDNKEKIEKNIREHITAEVRQSFELDFSSEYDTNAESKDLSTWINEQLKSKDKIIKSEIDNAKDLYFKKQLNLPPRAKPTKEQILALKERRANPTSEDKIFIKQIEIEVEQKYKNEAERYFKRDQNSLSNANKTKQEYVAEKIKKAEKTMQAIIEDRVASQLLSGGTPKTVLENYASRAAYKNAHQNPLAAILFFHFGMTENRFNEYLSLIPRDDIKRITPVKIEGAEISSKYKDYYLMKLDPMDPRGAILGKLTSCCQSLGAEGAGPASHGIVSPNGGFYVLCKKNVAQANYPDSIVAQCWAWRGGKQELVFDSIESQIDFRNHHPEMLKDFYTYLGHKLVANHGIPRVFVGAGGATPKDLGCLESSMSTFPTDYMGYRDSMKMRIIADEELPLLNLYMTNELSKRNEKIVFDLSYDKKQDPTISKSGASIIRDSLAQKFNSINNQENANSAAQEFIKNNPTLIKMTGLTEQSLVDRIELVKKWTSFIFQGGEIDRTVLQNFINQGVNVNIPIHIVNMHLHLTLLSQAINKNDSESLKLLVKNGADLNFCYISENSLSYQSAPKYAIYSNKMEILQSLITDHKIDVNSSDYRGYSLLHFAISHEPNIDRLNSIEVLLKNGANINSKTVEGNTPLLLMAKFKGSSYLPNSAQKLEMDAREKILECLIKSGADVTEKDNEGKTIFDFDLPPSIVELLKQPRQFKGHAFNKQQFFHTEPINNTENQSNRDIPKP